MTENVSLVTTEELHQAVTAIFEAMMGLQVSPSLLEWRSAHDRVSASVHFSGSQSAAIVLEVSQQTACQLAGRFLSMEATGFDNDVRDVLGELANMIGGNLKSAIAPDATLSMPEVVDGGDFTVRFCGSSTASRMGYECEVGQFWISLIHHATFHAESV